MFGKEIGIDLGTASVLIFVSCTHSLSVVFVGGNENVVCFFSGVLTYDLKS